jgi:glycosyltransferase involved in cell wall biosynthesis
VDAFQGLSGDAAAGPLVSVVVPVYNAGKYLRRCLDSLIGQTLKNIEILCINDGSTDNCLEILKEYAVGDGRVRLISKPNSGYGHTVNLGIAMARADHVGILESDDYAEPNMFERLLEVSTTHDLDTVCCCFKWLFRYDEVVHRPSWIPFNRVFAPIEKPYSFFVFPSAWTVLYKKDFLRENKIRFLESPDASFQDTSFVFKCRALARRHMHIRDVLVHYRSHGENASAGDREKVFCIADENHEIGNFLAEHGVIKRKLGGIRFAALFFRYLATLQRIAEGRRPNFAEYFRAEFLRFQDEGCLDSKFFHIVDAGVLARLFREPLTIASVAPSAVYSPRAPKQLLAEKISPGRGKGLRRPAQQENEKRAPRPAKKNVSLSLIVPVRNGEAHLCQCLDSVVEQSSSDVEILCVDGGSTDKSGEILEAYARRDRRIRVISKESGGPGDARNAGLDAATAPWVGFLDADDYLHPKTFERTMAQLHGDIDLLCFSNVAAFNDPQNPACHGNVEKNDPFYHPKISGIYALTDSVIGSCNHLVVSKLYRKSTIDNHGLRFAPEEPGAAMVFHLQCAVLSRAAKFIAKPLYHRRLHEGSSAITAEGAAAKKNFTGARGLVAALRFFGNFLVKKEIFHRHTVLFGQKFVENFRLACALCPPEREIELGRLVLESIAALELDRRMSGQGDLKKIRGAAETLLEPKNPPNLELRRGETGTFLRKTWSKTSGR